MNRRLPPQPGEWIDRTRPLHFEFEGRAYQGFAGDMVSTALWANDVRVLGRSFKYHRPRGIYSLAGHDANVMLEDGHDTNLRGDLLPLHDGMRLRSVNTWGGLARDHWRWTDWFGRFLPVGFYYKAFHTPQRLFPFFERQMRKVAGLGRIPREARPTAAAPKDYAFCDLLVIGGGPAGLAAAVEAADAGLEVCLVEEQPRLGGSFVWQAANGDNAQTEFSRLQQRVGQLVNLRCLCSTQAAGCYADGWIALVSPSRLTKMRANSVLVASGVIEQPAVFHNNDVPGVMLGSAAQRLIHAYAVRPVERAVVVGANTEAYRVALDLHSVGVQVAALVDLRPEGEDSEPGRQAAAAGIDIRRGWGVHEAVPTAGSKRVRAAEICALTTTGELRRTRAERIACDGIVMSVGWTPNAGLLYQAGARFAHSDRLEQLVPRSLPAGAWAAGHVNGVRGLDAVLDDGRRAARQAVAYHQGQEASPAVPVPESAVPSSHPYPVYPHAGKKNFVDLDEDVHLADLHNAHQEGYDNVELLKRFTTIGMGPSQGKLANTNAMRILARLNGASINETGTTTSRPFHRPVPIGHLAGRRFHPQRRTPLDNWHRAHGAAMVPMGAWLRPEFYEVAGQSREASIFREAANVRSHVGLIDVSTLGKLEIRGPDALTFLERIYTGRFAKQPVGRIRYGLACDETGVIIEDGVIARQGKDHFYVTATSSGAGAFYRELQRWALIWQLDVTLVNATGHLAAMNLAGPDARAVLSQVTDLDLAASFPYLAVKSGEVAGVAATLLRVGFVGELGYEIHVPAQSARHVWQALMEAGHPFGLRPFGVEAQRLLRLEKGHLIVGQDTDALTTPFEVNAAWAMGKSKPFFVGARSLQVLADKEPTRRLTGLTFPNSNASRLPEECHLIVEDGEIAGRVTSIAKRSTLGHPLALAFLRPDLVQPGRRVAVRLDNGQLVPAVVTTTPFYDAENSRQQ